jgi:hypothetical protein
VAEKVSQFACFWWLAPLFKEPVIRRLLDERDMTCSSYGVGYEALLKSPNTVAADAKTLGTRFVRVAWIPHQAPFTADHTRAAAADFNRVGRAHAYIEDESPLFAEQGPQSIAYLQSLAE